MWFTEGFQTVLEDKSWQTFHVEGQLVNISGLACQLVCTSHLCHCHVEAATGNPQMNERGYVPRKLGVWTLNFEFHIIFTSQTMLFFN